MLSTFFILMLDRLLQALNGQQVTFDLHIDGNNYFMAALYYMRTLDQFLPITDAVLPLVGISFIIQNAMTGFRIFRFIKSFVPLISGNG
jgi:hypothetical protein